MKGIYHIKNLINNKVYIGSSKNIENRFKTHIRLLNSNKHINCKLQEDWNIYKESNFEFSLLEECEENKLLIKEQKYLNNLDFNNNYNIAKQSNGGDNLSHHPKRLEILERMSIINKEIYNKLDDAEKQRRSKLQQGENNGNYGRKHTEEEKKIMSIKQKENGKKYSINYIGKTKEELWGKDVANIAKQKLSDFAKTRVGNKNAFYGKHHTEEYKQKASERRKGKYFGNQNKPFLINDKQYNSLSEAAKEYNVVIGTIKNRLISKNYTNYKYI